MEKAKKAQSNTQVTSNMKTRTPRNELQAGFLTCTHN